MCSGSGLPGERECLDLQAAPRCVSQLAKGESTYITETASKKLMAAALALWLRSGGQRERIDLLPHTACLMLQTMALGLLQKA